jgi:hypothetical protein
MPEPRMCRPAIPSIWSATRKLVHTLAGLSCLVAKGLVTVVKPATPGTLTRNALPVTVGQRPGWPSGGRVGIVPGTGAKRRHRLRRADAVFPSPHYFLDKA